VAKLFQAKSFLTYWLNAVTEHSLHSPFLFDFFQQVIKPNSSNRNHIIIEGLRSKLLTDGRSIQVNDLGSGSAHLKTSTRLIKDIARTSLTPPKYSQLYDRLINFINAEKIIELGTSFGINTLYLASEKNRQVITFEGSEEIAFIAKTTFEFADAQNIKLIEGNIDHTLDHFTKSSPKIDIAFIDANHRYLPTIKYFNLLSDVMSTDGVVVVDDIHQSEEMEKAWMEIKSRSDVNASIDLFKCGILFFDPSLNKQHVVMQS
jgi:predicted O-methyltransferase YrrM